MEKRLTMILASLFLCVGMALAQTTVTGTVVSQEDGLPIIGATVRVDGTDTGTVTDVRNGQVATEVDIETASGLALTSTITVVASRPVTAAQYVFTNKMAQIKKQKPSTTPQAGATREGHKRNWKKRATRCAMPQHAATATPAQPAGARHNGAGAATSCLRAFP